MRFSDQMLGAIFLLAGLALGWYSYHLPAIPGQQYGAATFPLLIALGMVVCSAKLIFTGIRSGTGPLIEFPDEMRNPRALAGVAATILLILFYIFFSRSLGFIPTAIVVSLSMFLILKVHPGKAAMLAVVAAFACDFIFRTMLMVPLPSGIMPRLPW
ncbi:tripartite tricarboxylate transporter TctB family protein [Aquamicrobium zhengzhouense]|uniref:Tripartite tricarboxylate transporter TctB family protein n=1 Tax=Aquamicrobium zhengzhouense TaxID=2781738 RepID=A0ABS0SCF9_9HYPH|nr:tripartite tricarboxylate transporter TctB family protein [Aquamicrobium zhengzhouense]MBI1620108.1 tripartite tricarboxylate transporter TctB family protein [Aquamicrobium zhengzhouense]